LDVVQIVIVVGLSGDKTGSLLAGAAGATSAGAVASAAGGAVVAGSGVVVAGAGSVVAGVVVEPDDGVPLLPQAAKANTNTLASSNEMTFFKIICIPPF
jgi:hypothetical protein